MQPIRLLKRSGPWGQGLWNLISWSTLGALLAGYFGAATVLTLVLVGLIVYPRKTGGI